ncbi:hypothetical protein A0H81_03539 [Grifola frondosa]|uniref:Uncharacterized protein n=1 Tax=Grifola frondosa TaxID=5627 RepID=A0A1C7MJK9_GRIFR|nr:hypothetical protein A0H81_03539 [Grifola frondosa]
MSTSSVLRASLRRAGSSSCKRYSSTNAAASSSANSPADTVSLPAAKMRALVTLYQQSGDYITPENLDEAIDAAFIHNPSANFTSLNPEESYFALMDRLHERQILPRVGEANSVSPVSSNRSSETWSEYRMRRRGSNAIWRWIRRAHRSIV